MSSHSSKPRDECVASFRIDGMTCASCEILLERTLRKLPGITKVSVNHRTGKAVLRADASSPPSPEAVERAVVDAGYRIAGTPAASADVSVDGGQKWMEIGASLLVVFALWKLAGAFHLTSLVPSSNGALSLGGTFLIGLVAGTSSCLAVTGGLLLAVAATYTSLRPNASPWRKFVPLLQFNVGRLVSYVVLGGVVGLIGTSLTISARMTGFLNILIAFVMLWLALSMLGLLPKQSFVRPPKALSHWIHGLAERDHPLAPILLGALTFFLPCGFTQSLQLAALGSGSFVAGAMIMGTFALGTLPSLIGISAVSSAATGTFRRIFLTFAGTLVFVLALFNLNNALAMTGIDLSGAFQGIAGGVQQGAPTQAAVPAVNDGVQEIRMTVTPYGYEPSALTIKAGIPVRWLVDGTNALGCTSALVIPSLNVFKALEPGENVITFTPPSTAGRLPFSCSMGMVRGVFNVI